MKYIKSFNESLISTMEKWVSYPEGIDKFSEWVPKCFEFLGYLDKIYSPFDHKSHSLFNIFTLSGDLSQKDKFIEDCEDLREHIIKSEDNIMDGTQSEDNLMTEYISIKDLYSEWTRLSKIDISVYYDIFDIIEHVCDENDCLFDNYYISWTDKPGNNINYLEFTFILYDQSGVLTHEHIFNYDDPEGISSSCNISHERILKIYRELDAFEDKLREMSSHFTRKVVLNSGVVQLKVRLRQ